MTRDDLLRKKKWLNEITDNLFLPKPGNGKLYHYTSLPVLFSILENDAIWASGTRFSNDSSEEILIKNEAFQNLNIISDSFIICFSNKADCLSQWRGYCFNGGAAIEFDVRQPQIYSVLHANYDSSFCYEQELNAPLPVLYVDKNYLSLSPNLLSDQLIKGANLYSPLNIEDIIPYFKDDAFEEESEWRLLFGNKEGKLSKCIRFRTLKDGVKVPYIVVRAGELGKNYSRCVFETDEYTARKFDEMRSKGKTVIRIPQGNNQETIFYKIEQEVSKYNKKHHLEGNYKIRIYCEGHLPIRSIMVAPTYDRQRTAEKIKRYCWSNYWLRDVDVTFSNIPYIPPSE